MKILHLYKACGPSYVAGGYGRVLQAMGHNFSYWLQDRKCAFDAFSEFEPDVFMGTTFDLDEATIKCIANRPSMKVVLYASVWGDVLKQVDLKRYPLVAINDAEKAKLERLKRETGKPDLVWLHLADRYVSYVLGGWREIGIEPIGLMNAADTFIYINGQKKAEFATDLAYVGGKWGYKSRNIDSFLLPLLRLDKGFTVKIFGNQGWDGIPQYLGYVEDHQVPNIFASALVCPNISEPHSTEETWGGFDGVERPFKILSSGGFCVSDYVKTFAEDVFPDGELPMARTPQEYEELIRFYISSADKREELRKKGQVTVLQRHTYFNRVEKLMRGLGMEQEALKAATKHGELILGI